MAKKQIAIISTGGTIEKTYSEMEGVLHNQFSVLDVMIARLHLEGVELVRVPLMNKDSLDLTEETEIRGKAYMMTTDGLLVRKKILRMPELQPVPKGIQPWERWIDVSLSRQILVAYVGSRPVFVTLVSTGKKGTEEEPFDTPAGRGRIKSKHISTTMAGNTASDGNYAIQDVPWGMFFEGSYALHGPLETGGGGPHQNHLPLETIRRYQALKDITGRDPGQGAGAGVEINQHIPVSVDGNGCITNRQPHHPGPVLRQPHLGNAPTLHERGKSERRIETFLETYQQRHPSENPVRIRGGVQKPGPGYGIGKHRQVTDAVPGLEQGGRKRD